MIGRCLAPKAVLGKFHSETRLKFSDCQGHSDQRLVESS